MSKVEFPALEIPMNANLESLTESSEIVGFLKKSLQYKPVCQQILQQHIIHQATQSRDIQVTDEEIQAEADRQRRELHLERSADTLAWLEDQRITPADWEAGIRDRLLTQKLRISLFESQVEGFFSQNRLDFDQVALYQIIVPYEQLAQELFYQIEESEISFYEAAHLYDIDATRRYHCGYEGLLHRWSLAPEISTVVFGAHPREIIRPVHTEAGYHILLVEEFITAQLTPEIRENILDRMFQDWLGSELNYWQHR
jgi:parvulin-like peptidyl-prolyl isomerase